MKATLEECRIAALRVLGPCHGMTDSYLNFHFVGCDLKDEVIPSLEYEAKHGPSSDYAQLRAEAGHAQ